jgi:hypothetical protein
MADRAHPFYRLFHYAAPRPHWCADVVLAAVDFDEPSYDPEDSWTHTVKSKTLCVTSTREASEAVLRLTGAEEYQDWSQPGGWDAPWVALHKRPGNEGEST